MEWNVSVVWIRVCMLSDMRGQYNNVAMVAAIKEPEKEENKNNAKEKRKWDIPDGT